MSSATSRSTRGAELLSQVITEREERASIAIETNLLFRERGTVFADPRLVAAIIDRVTFNAHILETCTQSYRLRTTKTTHSSKTPTKTGTTEPGPKPPEAGDKSNDKASGP